MLKKGFPRFMLGIIVPSILAIGLFIVSIFAIIIPSFENNIMEKKKDMINELTNTAWSLAKEYNNDYQNGLITLDQAKETASSRISKLRYGDDKKDYFWIIDRQPVMVMHPYRNDMNGTDLSDYTDPNGIKLFVEAVGIVSENGEGYIHYQWQWKDDSTRIVPKLSFVKGFDEWQWIIGTGIYLEDVKKEISSLKSKLLRISFLIILVIALILAYIVKQSLKIENLRSDAEEKLLLSKQKYKSLVEASNEGTLLLIDGVVIFSNRKMKLILGDESKDLAGLKFKDLFTTSWNEVAQKFVDPDKSVSLETNIIFQDGKTKEVVISVSHIKQNHQDGYIIIVKDITKGKQIQLETDRFSNEIQTGILLMNQPVKHLISELFICNINTPIYEAASLMSRKNQHVLFAEHEGKIIGAIEEGDISRRAVANKIELQNPVSMIMSSPVVSIKQGALLFEALLECRHKNVSYLLVENNEGNHIGLISSNDIIEMQYNSIKIAIAEIEKAESTENLKKIYNRLPVLVNAMIESGSKAKIVTRAITSITDAITKRLIELIIDNLGQAPCDFCFIVMGSEGRMEQTLKTDQDNALILEDFEPNRKDGIIKYFRLFGKKISDELNFIGLSYCDGGIMTSNEKWVQPVSVWKNYFKQWITTSNPQDILDSSIFFDFRNLHGNEKLSSQLRDYINGIKENRAVFLYHLAQPVLKYRPPLSLFGNILGDNAGKEIKSIDIKKVMLPVTSFVRIYSLENSIKETNTLSRIDELYKHEIISRSIYENLMLSYNFLMIIRFRIQVKSISNNQPPKNLLAFDVLSEIEKTTFKKILSEISILQSKLSLDYKGSI